MNYSKNLHHFHRQMMQIIGQDKHIHYFLYKQFLVFCFSPKMEASSIQMQKDRNECRKYCHGI